MIIWIAIATFVFTLAGGYLALRFKDKLHLILGFSAGAVLGVVFFDLIPESIELGKNFFDASDILQFVALGFFIYLLLDRTVFFHTHHDTHDDHTEAHLKRGILGAGSFALHSFLDGIAIGLAFQVSTAIGLVVAIAVLVHDFSDGINTVNVILKNQGSPRSAFKWLLVDAIAPVLGAGSTLFFTLPEQSLGVIFSIFSGFFLYIGASDLIPESHHAHPKFLTTVMTLLGMLVIFFAVQLSGL